ncbi:MAG TPA: type II toxin-antitoxin system VapC family toxin [Solirubrobacterales bacterium]|nr:type II toxin-antitoxin system VapC family toxin [Solirubrobacterales bacterium]
MPVVDASITFEWLAGDDHVGAVEERLVGEQKALWAPELLDAEVGQVLRRSLRRRAIDPERATLALSELGTLPIHRIPHEMLVQVAWTMRDRVSFYDGLYAALATMLGEPLLTLDARLARSGLDLEIEVLA